jgi:hypothetical protein
MERNKIYAAVITGILLLALSFPVKNAVISSAQKEQAVVQKATRVEDKTKFDYAIRTQQGHILTYGKIKTTKPVKFPEMKKSYLQVEKTREEYTMHTRTVTDSKGNTHVETYWTWDYAGTEYRKSEHVTFKEHKYPAKLFDYSAFNHEVSASNILKSKYSSDWTGDYYEPAFHVRYYYSVVPIKVNGSMLANAGEHGLKPINGSEIELHDGNIDDMLKDNQGRVKLGIIIFYVLYVIVSGLVIFGVLSVMDNMY